MMVFTLLVLIGLLFYFRHKNARDDAMWSSSNVSGSSQGSDDAAGNEAAEQYEEMLQRERVENLWEEHHHHGDADTKDA